MPSVPLSFRTYLYQYNTLPGVPPEKEAKMKVKLNTEVTVDILIDGVLVKKPISEIPGMTREQAEAINKVRCCCVQHNLFKNYNYIMAQFPKNTINSDLMKKGKKKGLLPIPPWPGSQKPIFLYAHHCTGALQGLIS